MTKLEKLIEELCPNGVEHVKVKDKFQRLKGTPITATKMKEIENPDGEIRIFAGGKTVINANEEDIPKANITRVPAVLVQSRGVIDVVFYDRPFTFKNEMWAYTTDNVITVKYLYYVLKNNVQKFRDAASGMGSLPQISLPVTEEFLIPLPPLEVQAEIVKILDDYSTSVTALQQELEKELTARKKQYEYYAYKLFLDTNADNIEMSELADFVYGYTDTAKDEGDARFIRITDINEQGYLKTENEKYITLTEDAKKSLLHKGDIIMARTGATYGKTLYFDSDFPSVFASFLIRIIPNDKLLNRYYWHFTKTPLYWEQANKLVTTGGQPQFNTPAVKKIKIPVPPLTEQTCIVQILDRFDKLCNDISEGLPTEIEARRKQYEYYRDKLLTFKELKYE